MKKSLAFLLIAAALSGVSSGQGLSPYLPSAQRSRASGLLSLVDSASEGIEKRRRAAFEAIGAAERDSVAAFAAAMATRGGMGWAGPAGSPLAGRAAEGFSAARAQATAAARALAAGTVTAEGSSISSLRETRGGAAEKLAALVGQAGLDEKSQAAAARFLLGRVKGLGALFPEAIEAGAALEKGGRRGRAIWIDALVRTGSEEVVSRLLASRAEALKAAPRCEAPLARLEAIMAAYRSLVDALPFLLYPSLALSSDGGESAALGAAVRSLNALPQGRAASLLSAMEHGDGRDAAAAESARRLADIARHLPYVRQERLAKAASLGRSELMHFALSLCAASPEDVAVWNDGGEAERSRRLGEEAIAISRVWSALAQRQVDEEEIRTGKPKQASAPSRSSAGMPALAADPLLPLLRRPELLELARREALFARFYVAAGSRLGELYRLADAEAVSILFADPATTSLAYTTLGEAPLSMTVVSFDLPAGTAARVVGFRVVAKGATGAEISVPIGATAAAKAYAVAFARAFGIVAKGAGNPEILLGEYSQRVVEACLSPEGVAFIFDSVPSGPTFGTVELETALLEGEAL